MKAKERLCWAVVGGLLLGIIIGLCVSPLTARDDRVAREKGYFGELICGRLIVVDSDGNERVVVEAEKLIGSEDTTGVIELTTGGSKSVTELSGGWLTMIDAGIFLHESESSARTRIDAREVYMNNGIMTDSTSIQPAMIGLYELREDDGVPEVARRDGGIELMAGIRTSSMKMWSGNTEVFVTTGRDLALINLEDESYGERMLLGDSIKRVK